MEEGGDIRKAIEAAWAFRAEMSAKAFDGFNGEPPDWFPDNDRRRFHDYRNKLLSKRIDGSPVTDIQVLEWIGYIEELRNLKDIESVGFVPEEVAVFIDELEYLKYVASLGKKEGLPLLIDEKAASLSMGGTHKQGKEYEPKKSIRAICEYYGSYEYDYIKPKILMLARGNLSIPVEIVYFRIGKLTDGEEVLEWWDSYGKKEEGLIWKHIKFDSLKDYLSKMIKQKNNLL